MLGFKQLCLLVKTFPASEKSLSAGTEVAGMPRKICACSARSGKKDDSNLSSKNEVISVFDGIDDLKRGSRIISSYPIILGSFQRFKIEHA